MDDRALEVAQELCRLAGAADLFEYLGLKSDAPPAELQAALGARRRRMQGMQGNPKFKAEATHLIRHHQALQDLLADPARYKQSLERGRGGGLLAVLELTARDVLKAGRYGPEEEEFLSRNARELGVEPAAFASLLERLLQELGVTRSRPAPLVPLDRHANHYEVLGLPQDATFEDVRVAYHRRARQAALQTDPAQSDALLEAAERAWDVLGDPERRRAYDLALGAPTPQTHAADRDQTPSGLARRLGERLIGHLERLGPATYEVAKTEGLVSFSVELRNSGGVPLASTCRLDAPWLQVDQKEFALGPRETRTVIVQVDADAASTGDEGTLTVQAERANEVQVRFLIVRRATDLWMPVVAALILPPALVSIAAGLWWLLVLRPAPGQEVTEGGPPPPKLPESQLIIEVSPSADSVWVNGASVGSGRRVVLANPPPGSLRVQVRSRNFATHEQVVEATGPQTNLPIELRLESPMDWRPPDGLAKGQISQRDAELAVREFSRAFDECVRAAAPPDAFQTGTLRLQVGSDGVPMGIELTGDGSNNASVQRCMAHQAAAVRFPRPDKGDYATVRYDYTVRGP